MAILSRTKIHPQQRYDLEDYETLLSAARTDAKLWTKQFLSSENLILKGFSVSGIGLKDATILMADATLIIPQGTFDFSWFTSAPAEPNIVVSDADLVDGVRNYLELSLTTEDNTPLNRAFWDPDANLGEGAEFTQTVNTVTDLKVNVVVSTGGFSGSVDRIPLAIVDTDGSGNIKLILDRRRLFGRLSTPSDLDNEYTWGTKQEPVYSLVMTSVTGVFQAGETITIGSETATVVTGGTTSITFNIPSGINFTTGDSVLGGTSSATGTVDTVLETFIGVDKNLDNLKEIIDALMTEIKSIKNTRFWWQDADTSLTGLISFLDSVLIQAVVDAEYSWDGNNFSITDGSGIPANSDVLAYLRRFGKTGDLSLTRQDGSGGSSVIPVAENEVLFIKVPETGSRTYSGVGSSDTNYQVADIADYVNSDENYWIAYRESGLLYVRGYGELESGESTPISDPDKETILSLIAASTARANQDRNLKLIEGGTWSLVDNAGTYELTLSQNAFIQIPGLNQDRNTVAAQTINFPNATSIAYIELLRDSGVTTIRPVTVADESSVVLTDDILVIARRVDDGVLVGANSFLLQPGEYLTLDGALAEVNRLLGQLKIVTHESDLDKVRISASDVSLLDGNTLSQAIGNFLLDFDGAVIDFTTGEVFESDGTTPLGTDFTPFTIPASEYFWYGISLIPGSLASDNRQLATLLISLGSAADAVQADAPKPVIAGTIKRGAVQVQNNGGSIEVVDIVRLGVGSGSGGASGIKAKYLDPISTVLPSGASVTIDGVSGVNGDTVLFTNLSSNNNRIYELNGVGSSITWTPVSAFELGFDPQDGDSVRILAGDSFQEQLAVFDGTNFKVNDIVRYFDGVSADFWELSSIKTTTLADATTASVFEVNVTGSENWIVSYSIVRGSNKETGNIYITSDGTDVSVSRSAANIGDVGVEFIGDVLSGDIRLRYTTTSTGNAATMKYFVKRWSNSSGGPTGVPNYSGATGGSIPAAGATEDVQFKGGSGNLDADTRFKWDVSESSINLDGYYISSLQGPNVLLDNQAAPVTTFSFDASLYKFAIISYSVRRGTQYRTGRLLVSTNGSSTTGFSDDFVETGATGITFSVNISGSTLEVQYTSTSTGVNGELKYSINKWG